MNNCYSRFLPWTGASGTSSTSGAGSSPTRAPKRQRNKKRDAKTKGLRNTQSTVKQVPHLFHLHIFDPTATPAQLPQCKKNVMLDTRQLYRTWNFTANKVIQGSSNKKWDEWQETKDPRLGEWHQVTEMLAKEKERQILAGFIALNPPQKTRNYGRQSDDGVGPAPPMDAVRLVGFGGQVIGSDGERGDQLAYNRTLAADQLS